MDLSLNLDDVLLIPQWTTLESRKEVVLEREFKFYHSPRIWNGIPIACTNMVPVSSRKMYRELSKYKIVTVLHKYYSLSELEEIFTNDANKDYVWVSIGKKEEELQKIIELSKIIGYQPNIVIDVPCGYIQSFIDFCARVRGFFNESILCAGNIATSDMISPYLIYGKVDICKIQIGVGSACKTRLMTGVGVGSYSCIRNCSKTAHGLKSKDRHLGLVASDGGLKYPGCFAKAFSAGSDFLFSGSFFAGTDECDNCEWITNEHGDKQEMIYYGMSTHHAQKLHANGKNEYRASEGDILRIPYKGPVIRLIQELLGGIRSSCCYIGSHSLKDMPKCAKFVQVNNIHENFYINSNLGL